MIDISLEDKYLFVVTDIHGNLLDFMDYMNLWLRDTSNHICFTGDLIHGDSIDDDGSLEILDIVSEYLDFPTFHILMGNHEHSQLYGDDVYRYDVNQREQFISLIKNRYHECYREKYDEYKKLLSRFDYYLSTSNGLLISHTGINEDYLKPLLKDEVDIYQLDKNLPYEQKFLDDNVWARPYDDYTEETINRILNHYNLQYWICGHTNYNGCHIIGNQLIIDSSHNTDTKYYLKIKLNHKYKNIIEILKQLKRR